MTRELARKSKVIEELKMELRKVVSSVKPNDLKRDEDLTDYLSSIIKSKDREIQQKEVELKQGHKRE